MGESSGASAGVDVDVEEVSPRAWRLLRVAAGYEQRAVERELDEVIQAHLSMLENDRRGLSAARRRALLDLYAAELTGEQVSALVEAF
jgi:plasmid stability protein